MHLPFTTGQFFSIFREYNEAVWPMQVILTALALAAVVAALRPGRRSGIFVSAVLALLWAWLALAYHVAFFARINPLAYEFAALSAGGATAFLWVGVFRCRLRFSAHWDARAATGGALIVYGLAVYPALCMLTGHSYPAMPTFGLPCPTTLFTIGLLAFAEPPLPRVVLIAPLVWCVVGLQGAFLLDVRADFALGAAAAIAAWLMLRPGKPAAASRGSAT